MLLELMPTMMGGIDLCSAVPETLKEVGNLITLTGVFTLLAGSLNDEELVQAARDTGAALKGKIPHLAQFMGETGPLMTAVMKDTGLMDALMHVMGELMPLMMPMMRGIMPIMMNERMPELMLKHEKIKELMPEMMVDIMPECLDMIAPEIERGKREAFFARLTEKIRTPEALSA